MQFNFNRQVRPAFALKPLLFVITSLFTTTAIAADRTEIDLASVPVTGNPLGVSSDELVVPVTVLKGRELTFKRESTLGDTLNGIPGVSATSFGPNSSRPVIRGLDAERVRILQNGLGILDAASLSFDHAVALDPLVIEQIEVVRGPAALLYGGSAMGGVVNAIDHRIPTEKLEGMAGRAEASFGGANSQNNGAGVIDIGNGKFAIHADAYTRKSSDLEIPGFAVSRRKNQADGTERDNRGRLMNSSAESDGGALGASMTFDNGYAGVSYSGFNNNYGVIVKPDVRIDMESDRWDFASEIKELNGPFNRVKFKLAHTDYQHQEIKGGKVDTTFSNRGMEGSLELGHADIGRLKGVLGMQFQNSNFEASGDEAFVPGVNTQSKAAYLYEELGLDQLKLTFGGRIERVNVDSKANEKFGAGQNNSFTPISYAFGGLYTMNSKWSAATNLLHNERAPSYFELYANGAHLATGQFEIGNSNLDKERSNGIDAQLRWRDGKNSFNVGAYYTRFSNFIGLFNTGEFKEFEDHHGHGDDHGDDDHDEELPVATFRAVSATFKGLEMDGKFNIADHWDLTVRGDYVRATNRSNGRALPRIAPLRLGAGLQYQKERFGARLDVLRAFKQDRTSDNELATDGYTNVSLLATYKLPTTMNLELFAKGNNLLDQEIREHASFLKDLAPQAGRSVLVGLRADF
jgi:iron complex outermembrane receptor protein